MQSTHLGDAHAWPCVPDVEGKVEHIDVVVQPVPVYVLCEIVQCDVCLCHTWPGTNTYKQTHIRVMFLNNDRGMLNDIQNKSFRNLIVIVKIL